MRILSTVALMIACTGLCVAQNSSSAIRWFGDLRIRGEIDMRDFKEKTPPNAYTLLRVRLGVEATPIENVRVLIQMRDSRVFGQERDGTGAFNTLADSRNLDLHQGYVELDGFPMDAMTVKIGRQEMSYGNERIIGTVGWNNNGRVFDGGLLRIACSSTTIDFLAVNLAEVQTYAPVATPAAVQYVRDAGSDLYGAYFTTRQFSDHSLDGYALYQSDRNQTVAGKNDLSRWTVGGLVRGKASPIEYDVEAVYQAGTRRGMDVSAYLLAGSLYYTFEGSTVRRLGLGYDRLSGTKAGSSKHQSFDPLFHTGHKFYGFMDYFVGFPANTADRGLVDFYLRGTVIPGQVVTANVWLHTFRPDSDGRLLGHEVDCTLSYRLNTVVVLDGGMSAFLPGVAIRERFGGNSTGFWGFLAASVSF